MSGVVGKKVGGRRGAGCCNFPSEEIMAVWNFHFAPQFPQNGVYGHKCCILRRKLCDNFSIAKNLRRGGVIPSTMPLKTAPTK